VKRYVVALTGASGMIYAREVLAYFGARPDLELHVIASAAARQVLALELDAALEDVLPAGARLHPETDFAAPLASGSFRAQGLVVVPCTMGTLGAIAQGQSLNLIHRAADVFLKERRPVILVVRETPLNLIHLRNMTAAAEAGAVIFPAMPSFYHRPENLTDLARNFAGRILDHLGLEHRLTHRWGEEG